MPAFYLILAFNWLYLIACYFKHFACYSITHASIVAFYSYHRNNRNYELF